MPDIPTEAREQLKTKVNRIADRYAGSLRRSSTENDERGKLRKEIKDMGYSAEAFQPAVSIAKSMNRAEAEHYLTSLQFFVESLLERQMDLFPQEAERIRKKAEAEILAKQQAEREDGTWSSENPRSDPKRGGAGKVTAEKTKAVDGEVKRGRGRPPGSKNKPKGGDNVVRLDDSRPPSMRGSDPVIDESLKGVHEREQAEGAAILADAGKPKAQSQIARDKLAEAGLPGGMH